MVGRNSRRNVAPYDADVDVVDVGPAYDEEFNEQYDRNKQSRTSGMSSSSSWRKMAVLVGVAALVTAVVTTTVVLVDRNKTSSSGVGPSSSSSSLGPQDSSVPQDGKPADDTEGLFGTGFEIVGVDEDNEHNMIGHDIDAVDIQAEGDGLGQEGGGGGNAGLFGDELVTGQSTDKGNNGKGNGQDKKGNNGNPHQDQEHNVFAEEDPLKREKFVNCVTRNQKKNGKALDQIEKEVKKNHKKPHKKITLRNGEYVIDRLSTNVETFEKIQKGLWKDNKGNKAEFECGEDIAFQLERELCDTSSASESSCGTQDDGDDDDEDDRRGFRRQLHHNGDNWHYPLGQAGGTGMKKEILKALVIAGVYDAKYRPTAVHSDPSNAWNMIDDTGTDALPAASQTIKVCIADSGYDLGHPDLPNEPQVTGDDLVDSDGVTRKWNQDFVGHGTEVAGIIAAQPNNKIDVGLGQPYIGNDRYVEGVMPNVQLHITRAVNDIGGGHLSDVDKALIQCRDAGADIINLSAAWDTFVSASTNALITDLYDNYGILTFVPSGNYKGHYMIQPAAHPAAISVGSINNDYGRPDFVTINKQTELLAKGNAIPTTTSRSISTQGYLYKDRSGTSFSTPYGAGVAAFLLSHFKGTCNAQQVRSCMAKMAKMCSLRTNGKGLANGGQPMCEVCNAITGLKTCQPNACVQDDALSTCGSTSFSEPSSCSSMAGTCCDDREAVKAPGNPSFDQHLGGHGVIQARLTYDALDADCDCGGAPRIQTHTDNICDSACSNDNAQCDDSQSCSSDTCDADGVCAYSLDTDGDRTPDCIDECPTDPNKKVIGTCGCHWPECNPGYECQWESECVNIDECATGADNCHVDATCTDTQGSFECECNVGYMDTEGSDPGTNCIPIPVLVDECATGADECHDDATCTDTPASYTCSCNVGFDGDGFICSDIDECFIGTDSCHKQAPLEEGAHPGDATCTNTIGGYDCACPEGMTGNGFFCLDRNECYYNEDDCHADAICTNTIPGYTCACNQGYTGDGITIAAGGTGCTIDGCPDDPNKTDPGVCGCGVADTDSDNDGTPDCNDNCPNDPAKTDPGVCGCDVADTDSDNDGTADCIDGCPDDPNKTEPGQCGCGFADTDTDGDLTADCIDGCPDDPNKTLPGTCGCGIPDADTDGDGTLDCIDQCPSDPFKTEPGVCGCGNPDIDSDNDGTLDCDDECPADPNKIASGECGCGIPETGDTDGDGVHDCNDGCPNDPNKADPGVCGCDVADIDSDNDGTPDCNDQCPSDPLKTDPGVCGCGVADTDSDNDGTPDCNDQCPSDPLKTDPGVCGCGVTDIDSDNDGTPDCNDNCPNDSAKTDPGVCGCGVAETDCAPQFVENKSSRAQTPSGQLYGPIQYEAGLGIASQDDSCVVLVEMNDNAGGRCQYLGYNHDLICPRRNNKGLGDKTEFKIFTTLTCDAEQEFANPSTDWHMHAKWFKGGDEKRWDGRRNCNDDGSGKNLKDLTCDHMSIRGNPAKPAAYVEVWFYAAAANTEPDGWENANESTKDYCYFKYEMKCDCGDCDP